MRRAGLGVVMLAALRIVCLASIACLAGVLVYATRIAVDGPEDRSYQQDLRTFQELNTALGVDLLESRSGLITHYDALTRRLAQLHTQRTTLVQAPGFLSEDERAELADILESLGVLLDEAEDLVEWFKFHNAVLRNSLRFFPGAARELSARLADQPGGGLLAARLGEFLADVLLYASFGEPQLYQQVHAHIVALRSANAQWLSPADRAELELLLRHGQIIVDRKPIVDDLVARVLRLPTDVNAQRLQIAYARHHASAAATVSRCRIAMFALALCVVVSGAAYIIARLHRSARALRESSADLANALSSLEVEKQKQTELAELKSRFVSMTSHEFRTPLSVILSSSELLEAYGPRWPADKRSAHLSRIQIAAKEMTRMLDEVLLLGRAEAGALEYAPRTVDVAAFCETLVSSLRLQTHIDQEIVYTATGRLHDASVDARLLTHVLDNLLSNAIKYSPTKSTVSFDVHSEGDDAVFTIEDHGIGIPDEDRARLFETFHRGKNVGHISGTGLGLAIVKRSVDAHHGQIFVESAIDCGTKFTVRVPMRGAV